MTLGVLLNQIEKRISNENIIKLMLLPHTVGSGVNVGHSLTTVGRFLGVEDPASSMPTVLVDFLAFSSTAE